MYLRDLFNARYSDRNPIAKSTVTKIMKHFTETGTVKNLLKSSRPKIATNDENYLILG